MREEIIHLPLSLFIFFITFKIFTSLHHHAIASIITIIFLLLLAKKLSKTKTKHNYKIEVLMIYAFTIAFALFITIITTNKKIVLTWYCFVYIIFLVTMFSVTFDLYLNFADVDNKPAIIIRPDADYYVFPENDKVTIHFGNTKVVFTTEEFEEIKYLLDKTDIETFINLL